MTEQNDRNKNDGIHIHGQTDWEKTLAEYAKFLRDKVGMHPEPGDVPHVPEEAFSPDGFLINQDYTGDFIYRGVPSSLNGCGWIACYNLLHFLGSPVSYEAVHRELDDMHPIKVPGPTSDRTMRQFLSRYVYFHTARGLDEILAAARKCRAGILYYWENDSPPARLPENILPAFAECYPHYTTFVREDDGDENHALSGGGQNSAGAAAAGKPVVFRFFNVNDGLEDCRYTMEEFLKSRCAKPAMHAYVVRKGLRPASDY